MGITGRSGTGSRHSTGTGTLTRGSPTRGGVLVQPISSRTKLAASHRNFETWKFHGVALHLGHPFPRACRLASASPCTFGLSPCVWSARCPWSLAALSARARERLSCCPTPEDGSEVNRDVPAPTESYFASQRAAGCHRPIAIARLTSALKLTGSGAALCLCAWRFQLHQWHAAAMFTGTSSRTICFSTRCSAVHRR